MAIAPILLLEVLEVLLECEAHHELLSFGCFCVVMKPTRDEGADRSIWFSGPTYLTCLVKVENL